jgi:hypothetical protein
MYLAVVLICSSMSDATTCLPVPNTFELFETREECALAADDFAYQVNQETDYFAASWCYPVEYWEEV